MAITISTTARNASGQAVTDLIDSGSINATGYIEIRSGARPSNPQQTATGLLLSQHLMSNPAFPDFVAGVSVANPISDELAAPNGGEAKWFRIYNRDNIAVWDGDVGEVGENRELIINDKNIEKDGKISIVEFVFQVSE